MGQSNTHDSSGASDSLVLTLNVGSSSIKFALYRAGDPPRRGLDGKIERIGVPGTALSFHDAATGSRESHKIGDLDREGAARFLCDWLARQVDLEGIAAIGHRIVNGGTARDAPVAVTGELLGELRRISSYASEHLPAEIGMIELLAGRVPRIPQVACFDTAFHRHMPKVARILPIPRRFLAAGVERQGFHGLSYSYLLEELGRIAGAAAAHGRVVLAHLGNGASVAAVRDGRCIDTSMAFTPAAGLPMSTRSGDLDPGLFWYFSNAAHMNPQQIHHMINNESGLLGVSETSPDVRDLLAREKDDSRAAEAVAMFCYQAKKWVGAFAAALGGLDTLVFAGGIGENAPLIRARICEGLDFLGLSLDDERNAAGEPLISASGSRVQVRVMRTDEDVMIARAAFRHLDAQPRKIAS